MKNRSAGTANQTLFERYVSFCYRHRMGFLYTLVFFLPVGIMYGAYVFFKIHPFGDSSVLVLDLNGQYVYYYEHFRDAFWGNSSFIYSWSRNLSGEMFGIFGYYLASPFMIIILLLPRTMMATSILILQLAKIGSASLSFMYFLKKVSPKQPRLISLVIFPTMYALMSYMVVQLMDPMWLDGLIYLPLICVGVHKLVNEGKMLHFIIPLSLMFIAHFYIGYMVGIFTFMYFCYCCVGQPGRILPKRFFSKCVKFGAGTLIALMCAAWVLIPVYNSLKLGKLEFTDPDYSMATQFDFLTFITKLFPLSYDTVYPEGLPFIYCGALSLLLIPLFYLNSKIDVKEKASLGILTILMAVLMYLKPVDIIMHGFQVPNWLPFRYSFAFSFLFIYAAFRAFENLDGVSFKNIGGVVFGFMVFLFWCERENYEHFQLFRTKFDDDNEPYNIIQGIWISMIAMAVYFLMLYLLKKYPKSKSVCIITVILLTGELFLNCADTIDKIDIDVAYSKYSSYEPYISELRDAVSMMKGYDTSKFYRMESTFHRTVNDPIATGYMGISHSSSTMNSPALEMLHKLGYAFGGHYTKYDGTTFMTDALFDIKYLMDKTGDMQYVGSRVKVPEEYKLTTQIEKEHISHSGETDGQLVNVNYKFYNNPNALGLGIVCDPAIEDVVLGEDDPFWNQNMIFNALNGDRTQYFTKLDVLKTEMENVATSKLVDGHSKFVPADQGRMECHVDYVVKMDKDSYLYMYLPTSYERSCNVFLMDEEEFKNTTEPMEYMGQFFVGDNYSIMNFGKYEKGQELRIRISISNDDKEAFWRTQLFYTFDYDAFAKTCEQLQQRTLEVTEFEDTHLEGVCTAENNDQVLFTTIPYEDGWNITVNGKKIKAEKSLDSLITIPLEKGENKISMTFSPNYLRVSVIISCFGVIMLVIVFLFEFKGGLLSSAIIVRLMDPQKNNDSEDKKDNSETADEDEVPETDKQDEQIIEKISQTLANESQDSDTKG